MRDENLVTEKSHMSILLTPRSKRMQYGLDLSHALLRRIQDLVRVHNGKFIVFYSGPPHSSDSDKDEMFVLNGKFYRVSKRQFKANMHDLNNGVATEIIPVTVQDWRVSDEDGHLNREATDQVMSVLADRLRGGADQEEVKPTNP